MTVRTRHGVLLLLATVVGVLGLPAVSAGALSRGGAHPKPAVPDLSPRARAAAAATGETVTVTPSTDLVNGQTVTVTGTGWAPGAFLFLAEVFFDGEIVRIGDIPGATPDAEGNFTQTLPVFTVVSQPQLDSRHCEAAKCAITVADPLGTGQIQSIPISFVDAQPDGRIRRRSDGVLLGDDVYNLDAAGQQRSHAIGPDGLWTFAINPQNDGPVADAITVSAPVSAGPVRVRYFFSYFDITAQVTGGGFTFPALAPGADLIFAVRFEADTGTPAGASTTVPLTFTSANDPFVQDSVRVRGFVATPS